MSIYKRIVIKVGSAVLTQNNKIAKDRMLNLVDFIVKLKEKSEVILVTSGAVAAGYDALSIDNANAISKKAIAATGQPILFASYKRKFDLHCINTAQILLTEEDFDSRRRTKIFQEIINTLLANNIVPIVNENDVTATPDQIFGDNDQLSAQLAHATKADLLVILSDIDGYYNENPKTHPDAKILKEVSEISYEALNDDHSANNAFATGGIVTKLKAANFLMKKGEKMFLCNGFDLAAAKSFLFDDVHTQGTIFFSKNS